MDDIQTLFDSDLAEHEHIMSQKVAPCPFCQKPVKLKIYAHGVVGSVSCSECKTMFLIPWDEACTDMELVHAWNARNERRPT